MKHTVWDIIFAIQSMVILLACCVALVVFIKVSREEATVPGQCTKAGYPEVKYVSGQWYCIGIRDGSSVAVPVGERDYDK